MTEHAPDRIWSSIDIPKTIAGVLAAVSAAVLGSFLGVAGTLAGAAVASVIGSVGTEIYHRWIDRGSKKIKSTFVTAPAAVGTPAVAAASASTSFSPSPSSDEEADEEPRPPAKLRWGRVAVVAGAVFVLAMGALTAFELLTHRTVADAVGNKTSSSTTVCSVFCGGNSADDKSPGTTPSDSAPASEGPAPDDTATTTEPTTDPTQTAEPDATVEPTEQATTGGSAEETQQPRSDTQPGDQNAPPADGSE